MNTTFKIAIKRRSQSDWLIMVLILMPFLFGFLNELLTLPWAIRYVMDIAWCALLVRQIVQSKKRVSLLGFWVWLFLIYTMLVYLVQFQSPLYYLWGLRNNFRFYAAFFAFAVFLTVEDTAAYWKQFDNLFWLNTLISVYQFFALDLKGDHLGGLFGVQTGSNGYTNVFFLIMVSKSIVFYLEKKEKISVCLAKCATALVVAAMAELKFFFLEFTLVIALAVLFTSFTWRKLIVILGGAIGITVCTALLVAYFPGYAGWFTISNIWESAASSKGYTSSGDLNRLNAIMRTNELWLQNGWQRLFGLGLGNCDTSGYAFLNTPFFKANEDMHYNWISYAIMYLETGWIGLIFHWGFFMLAFWRIWKMEKHMGLNGKVCCRLAKIVAILCIVISIYNNSLRTEAGYMAYFVLANPFVYQKWRWKENGKNDCQKNPV